MDKNTITGFILIALVVIGFSWYSQPSKEELAAMAQRDSIAAVEKEKALSPSKGEDSGQEVSPSRGDLEGSPDSTALFFSQIGSEGQRVVLHNNKVKVGISSKGAVVEDAEIIGYKSRRKEGDVVILGKEDAAMKLTLPLKQENLCLANLVFNIAEQTDSSVTFVAEQEGKRLQVSYTLRPNAYMLDMDIATQGLEGMAMPGETALLLDWKATVLQQEKGKDFENRYSSLTYKRQGKGVKKLNEMKDDSKEPEEALEWIAFKNQFFSAVLIAEKPMTKASLSSKMPNDDEVDYLKEYAASAQIPFDATGSEPTHLQMYLGPNDFHILKDHSKMTAYGSDADLDELVYLGWSFFRFINRWSILYIFDWLKAMGLPMGIVLLLLTIIIKVLVFPTQKKSYLSSAKMRVLKPKLDELTKQYPNPDQAMQKQQAMMQMYSQYGVSPMGGCLPMLIQMPIWIAMFNFIPNAIDLRGESFLWASDLSAYDDPIRWGTNLPLIGNHLSLFCILFSATNLINTWISMRQQQNQFTGEQAQQMKMMQWMMYLMPLVFFFWFNNYSSGLSYFYFISGLLNIATMWYLRWKTDDQRLLAGLEAYREQHKNDPKKTSGLQARLEALQKMQQEQARKR